MTLIKWRGDVFVLNGLKKPKKHHGYDGAVDWDAYKRFLFTLDPLNWRSHDLYKIMCVGKMRDEAPLDYIQRSYRIIARRFHPDKMSGTDKIYPCVIQAASILLNPASRRAFDSVDPTFKNDVPSLQDARKVMESKIGGQDVDKNCFFDLFQPVFTRNARWSNIQPVPVLGTWLTPDHLVEQFYKFWFNFDSWREYSYLDEEDKSKGQDKYERKAIEKANKVERQKRKVEELDRIHQLVDVAYQLDPRIALIKANVKQAKKAEKERRKKRNMINKLNGVTSAAHDKEHERLIARTEEHKKIVEQKQQALQTLVVQLSKEQSRFRHTALEIITDSRKVDGFLSASRSGEGDDNLDTKINSITKLLEDLRLANEKLCADFETKAEKLCCLNQILLRYNTGGDKAQSTSSLASEWTSGEIELLIKAIRLHPPGTLNRWSTIRKYLDTHGKNNQKDESQIMDKVKRIQRGERYEVKILEGKKRPVVATQIGSSDGSQQLDHPWTAPEQKLLEEGLKKHKATDTDRWDRIAEMIPDRDKAECIKRYRHIVEMLKKKQAVKSNQ